MRRVRRRWKSAFAVAVAAVMVCICLSVNCTGVYAEESATYNGESTIDYILSNYSYFVAGEIHLGGAAHTVGSIIADSAVLNQYFGNVMYQPAYLGTIKDLGGFESGNWLVPDPEADVRNRVVYYAALDGAELWDWQKTSFKSNPNYIDVSSVMNGVKADSESYLAGSGTNAYSISGTNLYIDLSKENILIPAEINPTDYSIYLQNATIEDIVEKRHVITFACGGDVIQSSNGGIFMENGATFKDLIRKYAENSGIDTRGGQYFINGMNLIWNFPNAASIKYTNLNGHLVAPNAAVTLDGGNHEGGVIAASVDSDSEAHFYPLDKGGTGSLKITVTDEKTKAPIPEATVEISYTDEAGNKKVLTATTDEDGSVDVSNLPPGKVDIEVKKVPEGYTLNSPETTEETVVAGQTTEVPMEVDVTVTGNLEITVTDEKTDEPIPGATVAVSYTENGKTKTDKVTTKEDGTVSVPKLPVGKVEITVTEVPEGYTLNSSKKTEENIVGLKTTKVPVKVNVTKSDIVDPTDPTNPEVPVNPTDPTNPEVPVNPTDPTNPEVPVNPADPTNPEVPVNPTDPTNPEVPVNPTDPTNPTVPVNPTNPTNPGTGTVVNTSTNAGTRTDAAVNTGDTCNVMLLISIFLLSGAAFVTLGVHYRKVDKK